MSFRIAFRAPASGEAASLSRRCSIFTWVGRQRAQGFHRKCPGRWRSRRVLSAELCACVSQEATACVSAHGGSIAPGHGAGRQARTRVAGRVSRARAYRRKQGIRTAHVRSGNARGRWSSSASGFGVSGPGEFQSSEWRSAEHVDNGLRSPEPQQFCGIGSAPCTTHSYAAIGL